MPDAASETLSPPDNYRDPTLPRLQTAEEIAAQTGLSLQRVYYLARERDLPHVRLGRAMRFDPYAVKEWIEAGGTGYDGPEGS